MGLPHKITRDDRLLEYALTDRQREVLETLFSEGSYAAAASKLGVSKQLVNKIVTDVRARAARAGYSPDASFSRPVPDGYKLRGTSTLYRPETGEAVLQWVKTTEDQERREALFREAATAFAGELPRAPAEPIPGGHLSADLLTLYPVGDHHLGMYAWHEEAGGDYDMMIGERLLFGAVDHLVAAAPQSERAAVIVLGDFLHYDSMVPETPTNRNPLDSDSRFAKLVRVAVRCARYVIRAALLRHGSVRVIIEIGNHDPVSSIFLAECLANLYESEPRVSVDRSPSHFHYMDFGKCLVGVHHGHGVKLEQLPLVMATDRPEEWGRTKYRYWFTGHIHKDRVLDVQGVRVESCRVLPPTDAWAQNSGYRSQRSMSAVVLHREYGEVARHTVNPDMLRGS